MKQQTFGYSQRACGLHQLTIITIISQRGIEIPMDLAHLVVNARTAASLAVR
ncbi:hypothetical protein RP20_CCG014996 [Aedes albopictus]|nr:hypothetical protein RP20_CCG014996 [Aedes albopictus]